MPWNGSGTYSPPVATFPEVNGTVIDANRYNPTISDLAAGITACLAKDGQNVPVTNLPMGGFKHTGANVAANSGEYVTFNQAGAKFPGLGIGTAPFPWTESAIDLSTTGAVWGSSGGVAIGYNTYYDAAFKAKITEAGGLLALGSSGLRWLYAASVSAGAAQTLVEVFSITSKGVQSGLPPSFYRSRALSSATASSGTTEAATYSSEVYDINGDFNPTTGRFTAPANGVYLLTWAAQANGGGTSNVTSFARVNGSAPNYGVVVATNNSIQAAGSAIIPMTAGQYLSIWMTVTGGLACLIDEFTVTRIA